MLAVETMHVFKNTIASSSRRKCAQSFARHAFYPNVSCSNHVFQAKCFNSSSILRQKEEKVYELRTYSLKPEHMKEYLNLTAEKFHLRTSHSILHGYWTVELGGVNQVVHLWEYDSYDHRSGVRAKLAGDQGWISQYFGKILPWLQQQENLTLNPLTNFETIVHPTAQGLYELWLIDHKADASKSFLNDLSEVLKDVNETLTSSQICGALQSEFGKVNTIAVIWQHQSFDHTKDLRQTWNDKGTNLMKDIVSIQTKALIPFKISPMQ